MKNNYQLPAEVSKFVTSDIAPLEDYTFFRTIQAANKFTNGNIFIIDYEKGTTIHLKNSTYYLSNINDEVSNILNIYEKATVPQDLNLFSSIGMIFFNFLKRFSIREKSEYMIGYDFHIVDEFNKKILLNHKITPLSFRKDGQMKTALCNVSLSLSKSSGNITVISNKSDSVWKYCHNEKKWLEESKIRLTDRETEVIRLYLQGYSISEIASQLFISIDTVKWHRRKLFEKLNVKNIMEAIAHLVINGIL
ncbi:response regulator transcription factor [Chryseobacterium arachidis]|nr:helix-turn-helix transcriptional regulator [Chryseobacterium arachidis]